MKQDYQQLLRPEIINSVSGMALIARVIVDGYLNGVNHSRRVGSGMEFSQYRSYEPGDDLRLLDWKMLARSGRYYIKQSEIETHIAVKFILDASKSMEHTDETLSKMDYSRIIIASLAYLCHNQGDAVGLFALNDHELHRIHPKIQRQHFNRLLLELLKIQNEGKWPSDRTVSNTLHDSVHKELIFFITDLYEYDDELSQFIKQLKTLRNEVVVLHIMGQKELAFDYKGTVTFMDLETGEKMKVDTKSAKQHYMKSLETMLSKAKTDFLANGINYHLFSLGDPIEEVLQLFLKRRQNLI